ncbi:MAG: hypothetical protein A2X49_17395 [Lentisphaerae bacterium GWF2_52_8]|nr:MAG: hypothetical protein A2X49_17395 [Lentisphaerae bacterium GWF2_52_8]
MRYGIAFVATILFVLCSPAFARDEFEGLDSRIVEAYNAEPKRSAEVYRLSMEMLDLARNKTTSKSEAWAEKAKKMLSLACLYEALAAQEKKDYKETYTWCARASSNGASSGEMGGFDLAEVASFLSGLQATAQKEMDASGIAYSNISLEFRPAEGTATSGKHYNPIKFSSEDEEREKAPAAEAKGPIPDVQSGGLPPDTTHTQDRLREGSNKGITVLEGPKQDRERNLYVKIKTPAGRELTISYVKGKGWGDKSQTAPIYYESWMKCAESIIRNELK